VSSIVPPLAANDDVGLIREKIDNLSFSFVTPLGTDKYCIWHKIGTRSFEFVVRTDK
jgi:hypothetical protein